MFSIVCKPAVRNHSVNPALFGGWAPFRVVESLLRDEPYTEFQPRRASVESSFVPRFDVKETKDGYAFSADLPGLKEENVEISLIGNRLSISGKREAEETKEGDNYFLGERQYGEFKRTFTLPESADTEKVTASMKDGVLTLNLPKRTEAQPRRVSINK